MKRFELAENTTLKEQEPLNFLKSEIRKIISEMNSKKHIFGAGHSVIDTGPSSEDRENAEHEYDVIYESLIQKAADLVRVVGGRNALETLTEMLQGMPKKYGFLHHGSLIDDPLFLRDILIDATEKESAPFYKSIPLNQPMTAAEAIKLLAEYHKKSQEDILGLFSKLGDTDRLVQFTRGRNNGTSCVVLSPCNELGISISQEKNWYTNIFMGTGEPQTHVS